MDDIISISQSETDEKPSLGDRGERLAAEFLARNGYRLVLSNFKVPVGRNSKGVRVTGEIDIIAVEDETLCFVEVKTRQSDEFAPLTANVDLRKQRQIIRTAKVYRRIFNIYDVPHRYDVVTVLMRNHADASISLLKNFWSEGKFKKPRWSGDARWNDYL